MEAIDSSISTDTDAKLKSYIDIKNSVHYQHSVTELYLAYRIQGQDVCLNFIGNLKIRIFLPRRVQVGISTSTSKTYPKTSSLIPWETTVTDPVANGGKLTKHLICQE